MACRTVKTGTGGQLAIVCSRGRKTRNCYVPHCRRPATKLCDHPVENGTCDAPICDIHARYIGPGIDHCPKHYQEGEHDDSGD